MQLSLMGTRPNEGDAWHCGITDFKKSRKQEKDILVHSPKSPVQSLFPTPPPKLNGDKTFNSKRSHEILY